METDAQRTLFNKYAEKVIGSAVRPLEWQGHYSYTVESEDGRTVVQFRSDQSPLNDEIVKLAKRVHPDLVPAMERLEFLDDRTISVWKMDKIPGIGFLELISDDEITTKLSVTVKDMAEFYIQAWESPQMPDEEQVVRVRQEFEMKLGQLEEHSSPSLLAHVTDARQALDNILRLPWVLTHDDLSSMNLLLDAATGNLRGVVDWADAAVRPFGIALWGLESVLGYSGPNGWTWLDDESCSFEKARKLGLLLRYGFIWQDNRFVLAKDTTMLEILLENAMFSDLSTYGHSQLKTGHPVRSAIHKQLNGRLVLRWVTTWESLL
ncbi:hypothetical protein KCU95_g5542, partial [Aureobasidium melanogenum]